MKKNFLFGFVMLLITVCVFSACGDDDDNEDVPSNGSNEIELNENDTIQNLKINHFEFRYNRKNVEFNHENKEMIIDIRTPLNVTANGAFNLRSLSYILFENIDFNNLKIGDDIVKNISVVNIEYSQHSVETGSGWTRNYDRVTAQSKSIKVAYIDKINRRLYLNFNIVFIGTGNDLPYEGVIAIDYK